MTREQVGVNVGVFALQLVDGLSEVGDELLLVTVIEKTAGKGSERWLGDRCARVDGGVEFQLSDAIQQESARNVSTLCQPNLTSDHDARFFRPPFHVPFA